MLVILECQINRVGVEERDPGLRPELPTALEGVPKGIGVERDVVTA